MARKELNAVSVYGSKEELEAIRRAAEADRRSVSNFLLLAGLEKAAEQGFEPDETES